jgi:hypothetical protein
MQNSRCITPPKVNTNIPYIFNENLNDNEFPIYKSDGTKYCPPAPPRNNKEIRICGCKKTYQIVLKTSPTVNCGNCSTT